MFSTHYILNKSGGKRLKNIPHPRFTDGKEKGKKTQSSVGRQLQTNATGRYQDSDDNSQYRVHQS